MKIEEFINKSFIFAIGHGYAAVWRKFNADLRKSDCNITEALVLIAVFFEPERSANPSAIARALRTSRGNVSHCLSKLEKLKYVRRTIAERDARRLMISLTPAGARLVEKLVAEIEKIEAYCEAKLQSLDQKTLLKALFALGDERK